MDKESITSRSGFGFLLCLAGELFYFGANYLLRWMSEYRDVSPDWTIVIKESVTVLGVLPFILLMILRGKYHFPTGKIILMILFTGFVCEFISSRAYLWSFALLGVVLAMPLYVTFQIFGSHFFSTVMIGETMTRLKIITTCVLIPAVIILSWSKWNAVPETVSVVSSSPSVSALAAIAPLPDQHPIGGYIDHMTLLYGLVLAFLGGVGSAFYMCNMRGIMRTASQGGSNGSPVPLSLSMFLICGSGMVICAVCLLFNKGYTAFYNVPKECWAIALGSGACNLVGFFFRNLGFRYVSASKIVFISVIQVLFMTIAGILSFHETSNIYIWIGLSLTILGIILAGMSR